eukprot:gene24690-31063_t
MNCGGIYTGEWLNDKRHGDGQFENNLFNGYGVITRTSDGKVQHEGLYRCGEPHGMGKINLSDGSVYTGDFFNGSMDGQGSIVWLNGNTYTGVTTILTGQFKIGELIQGEVKYHTGDVYVGELKAGLSHGQGVLTLLDGRAGNTYEGHFVDGELSGQGCTKFVNGDVHKGLYVTGRMQGKGVTVYANGAHFEGEFCGDEKRCVGVMRYNDGNVYEGVMVMGLRHGRGVMRSGEGVVLFEGEWCRGEPVL